jgi:cell division septum initiation protein DivIVA
MVFDTHIGGGSPQPKVEEDDDEPSVDDYMRMKAENKDLKQQILQLQEALNNLQFVENVSQNMFLEQEKKPRKKVTVETKAEAEDIVIDETVENIDDVIANFCIFSKQ